MPLKRAEIAAQNVTFYPQGFRLLLIIFFFLLAVGFGLLALIMYQHFSRPEPQFFVTTSDGRLIEIHPAKHGG